MPSHSDALTLLVELLDDRPDDRFDPDAPRAQASLERILAAPRLSPPAPAASHRARRGLAVTGAAASVAVAAVALWPSVGSSPDVVARAAAALDQPSTILHFKAQVYDHNKPAQITADPSGATPDQSIEAWQGPGARQVRELFSGPGNPGGDEFVEDFDRQTTQGYNPELNQLIDNNDPRLFTGPKLGDLPRGIHELGGANVIDDLRALVAQAQAGAGNIKEIGATTIRGIPVYELRAEHTIQSVDPPSGATITDPTGLPTRPVRLTTLIYVARETYLPVRIVDLGPPLAAGSTDVVLRVTDYLLAERLPDTPSNERLLAMSPHPGATRVGATASPVVP